ncbi:DUF167 domain-containing protein [Nitratifractor salsuginis]|uniref:UPF0235 protein Nitsa_0701 n=1 Tax=Nitratifractor salsuginis (strain DSM 16511 / JCM 12458 / E9I37-1) TaxID=749222 RepID=E6X1W0_NITSE|nr:DUF167 domain-containing protein [Nitratifractor salsuginis]ADV45968.1 protein of unknown function DUF167 [Nitratifractor salsuginis DSM 16511]
MFYEIRGELASLKIKAQPGASRSEFAGLYGDEAIKVRIAAAAVEGAANKELVKFLSKAFKVPKSSIRFKSGETAKIKVVEFPYSEKFKEFLEKLEDRN